MASTLTANQVVYTLTPPEEMVYGLQMSLDFNGSAADLASIEGLSISSDDYAVIDGKLNISWTNICLLYTSPSPRDRTRSRMPSSA